MPELGEPISERELDVLHCLAEGASNREIAQQLSISPNTVKVHLRNIYTKLGVSSRTEATTVALQKGVVTIPGVEAEEEAAGEEADEVEALPAAYAEQVPAEGMRDEPATDGDRDDANGDSVSQAGAWLAAANRRVLFLGGIAVVAVLLLAALAVGRLLGEDGAEGTPQAETATTPDGETGFVETPVGDNWLAARSLPSPRAHMAVVNVGLEVYGIGGEAAEGVDNAVTVYDTQERQWSERAPKITAVADATAAVLAGEIYVVGGRLEDGRATTIVEAYSPLNDGWRPVTPLPRPIAGGLALVSGGKLYLFGGQDGDEVLDAVYAYDPAADRWETLPAMQQARVFAAGGTMGSDLYVAGGSDGRRALATCERFDPVEEVWASCPDLLEPRAGAAAAVVLNKLYVIGGGLHGDVSFSEVYDAENESWSEVTTPMLSEAPVWPHLGVTNVETRIYALGGMRDGSPSGDVYVYAPLVYQFFIPAASSGGE